LLVAVGLCLAVPALGQQPPQPSAAAKNTARTLLVDGRAKFASGDYQGALKSFQGAHAIMGVPTTGLDLARAQEQLGQLTEARETAAEVMRFDSAGNQAYVSAQQAAATLAGKLDARIPALVLSVSGVPAETALEVTVDGEAVPPAILTLPRKVNPGEHTVLAKASGFADAQRTVNVAEKETKHVEITLERVGSAGVEEIVPHSRVDTGRRDGGGGVPEEIVPHRRVDTGRRDGGGGVPEEIVPHRRVDTGRRDGGGGVPTWAWVVGGAGVAAAGASIAFGINFAEAQARVQAQCPDGFCKSDVGKEDAADLQTDWNRSITLTVVFATVGVMGLGAATYGIVTAKSKEPASAMVVPWIDPGSGGVVAVGRF
jgi:hypothetical protein